MNNYNSITEQLSSLTSKHFKEWQGSGIAPKILAEFTEKSAIAADVFAANVAFIPDLEFDPITREVIATPIADALGWKYTRFGHQAKESQIAAKFIGEDGETWQLKIFGQDKTGKRTGQYLAPKGIGDVPFLPTIPRRIILAIAAKHDITPPEDGEAFWPWLIDHPEIPVIITEGGKKALSAISQGVIAIALYGCQCGNDGLTIKPALLPYVAGRKVTIAFDQDAKGSKGQKDVFKGTNRIARNLICHAKATVAIAQWHGEDGKGIDDLIANDPAKFHKALDTAIALDEYQNKSHTDLTPWINQTRDERYLSDINAPDTSKIIAIGAHKNTGKTEAISRRIDHRQADYRRTYSFVHRVQLGKEQSNRLGMDYISELSDSDQQGALGIITTIDQTLKIDPETVRGHDIILDECEQLIWELLHSDRGNLGKDRTAILNRIQEILVAATESGGQIILSDADLSPVTLKYISGLIGASRDECYIVVNKFNPIQGKRDLYHYDSPEDLLTFAINSIADGKKIQLCTGAQKAQSKYSTTNLFSLLTMMFPGKRIGVLDSHTIADKTNPAYGCMENLDRYLSDYDVILNTSVIETGISIDKPHFDLVVAFGQGTQTVEQFSQGIARYRLDVPRHVWINKRAPNNCYTANGETNPYNIVNTENKKAKGTINKLNQAENFNILDDDRPEHLKCWATMAALHNQGKKKYRETVLEKLTGEGYTLRAPDPDMIAGADVIAERITMIKDANYAKETKAIADSLNPDDFLYESLKRKQGKTEGERHQERKGDLCRALATDDITPEDVEKCDQGWLSQLTLHYYFTTGENFLQARDTSRIKKLAGDGDQVFAKDVNRKTLSLQIALLKHLGFDRFLSGIGEFSKTSLADWFEKDVLPNRTQIKQITGVTINPEKDTPIAFVQRVLKKFGLALTYLGRFGERGNTERRYGPANIDPDNRQDIFARWFVRDFYLYHADTVSTESLLINQA
jgi:hypothetical protein